MTSFPVEKGVTYVSRQDDAGFTSEGTALPL